MSDLNWILTLLAFSFSALIFMLGLPTIFMQTYLKDGLKDYYKKTEYYKKQKKEFKRLCYFLISLLFLFHNPTFWENLIAKSSHSIILYRVFDLITVSLFFIFFWLCYSFFNKNIWSVVDIKKIILNDFFKKIKTRLKTEVNISGIISDKSPQLFDIYKLYSSKLERANFLSHLFKLIEYVKKSKRYSGKELANIFESVLYDAFVINYDERSKKEFTMLFPKIDLSNKSKKLSNYDVDQLNNNFFIEFCFKSIKHKHIGNVRKAIAIMKKTKCQQSKLFQIYFHLYSNRFYSMLKAEVILIGAEFLKKKPSFDNLSYSEKMELLEKRKNQIAYLAYFFNINNDSKKLALEHINLFKITKEERIEAYQSFFNKADFFTAHSIFQTL